MYQQIVHYTMAITTGVRISYVLGYEVHYTMAITTGVRISYVLGYELTSNLRDLISVWVL